MFPVPGEYTPAALKRPVCPSRIGVGRLRAWQGVVTAPVLCRGALLCSGELQPGTLCCSGELCSPKPGPATARRRYSGSRNQRSSRRGLITASGHGFNRAAKRGGKQNSCPLPWGEGGRGRRPGEGSLRQGTASAVPKKAWRRESSFRPLRAGGRLSHRERARQRRQWGLSVCGLAKRQASVRAHSKGPPTGAGRLPSRMPDSPL